MAGRRVKAPPAARSLSIPPVEDQQTMRALKQVEQAVQLVQAARSRVTVTTDLAVGTNRIRHGLGRAALGYTVTPTVADASFAHAIDVSNPRPELEVWITVAGAAQPAARIEVF